MCMVMYVCGWVRAWVRVLQQAFYQQCSAVLRIKPRPIYDFFLTTGKAVTTLLMTADYSEGEIISMQKQTVPRSFSKNDLLKERIKLLLQVTFYAHSIDQGHVSSNNFINHNIGITFNISLETILVYLKVLNMHSDKIDGNKCIHLSNLGHIWSVCSNFIYFKLVYFKAGNTYKYIFLVPHRKHLDFYSQNKSENTLCQDLKTACFNISKFINILGFRLHSENEKSFYTINCSLICCDYFFA